MTRKTIENINETKTWFLEKMKKIDKHLARPIKDKNKKKTPPPKKKNKTEMEKETLQLIPQG